MIKNIGFLALFSITFATIIIFQANRLPADAKLCGDHWLKCYLVNQGLYSIKIYSKEKKFIKEQTYMLPYKNWRRDQQDLTPRVVKYDGDTIYLDKGMKLLACSVPYEAEMISSVDGLVWAKCEALGKEKNVYLCEIYSTRDGSLVSSGAYAMKKYYWDKNRNKTVYENINEPVKLFNLSYYDGVSIPLKDKLVLMPDGVIDYSSGPDSGLRVKYDKEGNELEREEY